MFWTYAIAGFASESTFCPIEEYAISAADGYSLGTEVVYPPKRADITLDDLSLCAGPNLQNPCETIQIRVMESMTTFKFKLTAYSKSAVGLPTNRNSIEREVTMQFNCGPDANTLAFDPKLELVTPFDPVSVIVPSTNL